MRTQSEDTHPEAERVQIELLRKASMEQRVRLARSLSQTALGLAWRAIEEANPGASRDELVIKFVLVHYGDEWADRLRDQFDRRKSQE